MTYKIIDGAFVVEKDIASLDAAKGKAEDYARETDTWCVEILDQDTNKPVCTGAATLVMEWKEAQ